MGADTEALTTEDYIKRLQTCLFEVGYHDIRVIVSGMVGDKPKLGTTDPITKAIAYQCALTMQRGEPMACYRCWVGNGGTPEEDQACTEGMCQHPEGPARPPREEIIGRV